MKQLKKLLRAIDRIIFYGWLVIVVLAYLLMSCSKTVYVPIESSTKDSTAAISRETQQEVTSQKRIDSIIRVEYYREVVDTAGRVISSKTVINNEHYSDNTALIERMQHTIDSLAAVNIDKTQQIVPVTQKSAAEGLASAFKWAAILFTVLAGIGIAIYLLYRRLKKPPNKKQESQA